MFHKSDFSRSVSVCGEKVCQLCWRLSTFGVPGGEREKRQNKIKKKSKLRMGGEKRRRGAEEKKVSLGKHSNVFL